VVPSTGGPVVVPGVVVGPGMYGEMVVPSGVGVGSGVGSPSGTYGVTLVVVVPGTGGGS
jgi:hypothetical protein